MKFSKIFIDSYGKFSDQEIEFKDGINLIYGCNEAGKSTVRQFISDMLYGQYKRGVKNRQMADEYSRYLPWANSVRYCGRMVFEKGGKEFTIVRNFIKGKTSVKIYAGSGDDVTEKFKYNDILHEYEPGETLLGLSQTTFTSTASITLSAGFGGKSALTLSDDLIAMSKSADTEFSSEKALTVLDKRLYDIGTERRKSPFKDAFLKVEELKNELTDARENKQKINDLQIQLTQLEAKKVDLIEERKSIEIKLECEKINLVKQKIERAEKLGREIEDLNLFLEKNSDLKNFSAEDVADVEDRNREISRLKAQNISLDAQLNETEGKLNPLKSQVVDEEKFKLLSQSEIYIEKQKRLLMLEKNVADAKQKNLENRKTYPVKPLILGGASLTILGAALAFVSAGLGIIGVIGAAMFVLAFILKNKADAANANNVDYSIQENEISILHREITDYLTALNFQDLEDAVRFYINEKTARDAIVQYENRREHLMEMIRKNDSEVDTLYSYIAKKVKNYGAESLDDLDNCILNAKKYAEYQKIRTNLVNQKDILLEGIDLEKAKEQISQTDFSSCEYDNDRLSEDIRCVNADYENTLMAISECKSRINQLDSAPTVGEIESQLEFEQEQLNRLISERDSLIIAAEHLREIEKELHNELAPALNSTFSRLVSEVTNDKYKSLKITPDLKLLAETADSSDYVDANFFSSGTTQAIYILARLALLDFLAGENNEIPLIFDDSFALLDMQRNKQLLKILCERVRENPNRQILFFTFDSRMKNFFEEIEGKVNFIDLKNVSN